MKKPYNFNDLMQWIRDSWNNQRWLGPEDILDRNPTYPNVPKFFSEFMTEKRRENGLTLLDDVIKLALLIGIEQGKLIAQKYAKAALIDMVQYSTLVRISKYYERGIFNRATHIKAVLAILKDIINRGFDSYEDFKDQIDAVDLGLVPLDLEDCTTLLEDLFECLNKGE